ncbi:MAG: putative toxin-antitoxin system toxin component, PIN family [Isosphaerales bacterium]
MTPRAVFDCMVFVQALANDKGPAYACLQLAQSGKLDLCVSPEILVEVRDVVSRPKLQRKLPALTMERVEAFLSDVVSFATFISEVPHEFHYDRDPKAEPQTGGPEENESRHSFPRRRGDGKNRQEGRLLERVHFGAWLVVAGGGRTPGRLEGRRGAGRYDAHHTGPDGGLRIADVPLTGRGASALRQGHNTTLRPDMMKIAADFAGYAQDRIEADHPGAVALFVTGRAGDADPHPFGTLAMAREHGEELGEAVKFVLDHPAWLMSLSGPLRTAFIETTIRFGGPTDRASYEKLLKDPNQGRRRHAQHMIEDRVDRRQCGP